MIISSQFAYSQARLHARHGERTDEPAWRQLETQQELANFLQSARRTSLRPWVLGMHAHDNWHQLEQSLLQQFHLYIEHVAGFQPSAWRAAVQWARQLLHLPSLLYLLSGNTAPSWMTQDPYLNAFISSEMNQRVLVMQQSDSAPLINAWQNDVPLLQGWLQHWRSLWPGNRTSTSIPLNQLVALLQGHLESFRSMQHRSWQERELLARQLIILFRRYSQQPVAVFIHLALLALDIERLRGNIMQRALFPELRGEQP